MKTLFSRILLAQVVAVVLALAVVTLITRASLNQGFKTFLHRQESTALQNITPALEDFYQKQGGWEILRENPNNWQKIWRFTRSNAGAPQASGPRQGQGRGRPREAELPRPGGVMPDPELRWLANPGRGMLRERLFLLDENRLALAGPETGDFDETTLEALIVNGEAVGWIGFAPMGNVLPPDASRFLDGQVKIMFLALAAALLVAAVLSWILARNVSRPVQRIGETVRRLSDGDFDARATDAAGDEIGTLATHVNQLAESLGKSRTARQRWMADIAHELRTPVSVMKGEIEAMADGVRVADEGMTASLTEEIDHLASMVDDLQALALADAGALNLRKEALDLAELAGQTAESFRNRLAQRKIRLETGLENRVEVSGDPQRLRQLLHNLLENSNRYVESGGTVCLTVEPGEEATLLLEDSGPGVSEEQKNQLFDRFYRAESSRARATGGSGLGLSICKNIAEAHGGRIEAEHSPLGGLLIRVVLPI
ncbi:MAG: ATP-binding protein [Xanthomonadales bacterium]|jgi:two-component system sensor histidine kinase BaeS|nr:ATP-binding protein [Xanthomonadales bacterium]